MQLHDVIRMASWADEDISIKMAQVFAEIDIRDNEINTQFFRVCIFTCKGINFKPMDHDMAGECEHLTPFFYFMFELYRLCKDRSCKREMRFFHIKIARDQCFSKKREDGKAHLDIIQMQEIFLSPFERDPID